MKLFHGTTLNRLKEIVKAGNLGTDKRVWDVSEYETTYFFTEKFLREEQDEYWFQYGLQLALESGDVALASERENLKRVVLVFDSEELETIGILETDDSARNMDHCLKFVGLIPLTFIKEIWIDKRKMDMFAIYFIGLAENLNNGGHFAREAYINDFVDYSTEGDLLEPAKEIYEKLCYWFMENYDTSEVLEKAEIKDIDC